MRCLKTQLACQCSQPGAVACQHWRILLAASLACLHFSTLVRTCWIKDISQADRQIEVQAAGDQPRPTSDKRITDHHRERAWRALVACRSYIYGTHVSHAQCRPQARLASCRTIRSNPGTTIASPRADINPCHSRRYLSCRSRAAKKGPIHVFCIALQCDWRKAATASSSVREGECNDQESMLRRYPSYC